MLAARLLGVPAGPAAPQITYVGGKIVGLAGTTNAQLVNMSGELTGGIASSPAAGDLVLAFFAVASGTTTDYDLTIRRYVAGVGAGANYTEIVDGISTNTYTTNFLAAWAVMGSTPDTGVSYLGVGDANMARAVYLSVWRNVHSTNRFDVTSVTNSSNGSILANPPAITPVTSGAVVVAVGASAHAGGPKTYTSSDLLGFMSTSFDDTYDIVMAGGYLPWTGGTVNPAQFSTASAGTGPSAYAISIALRPTPA